MSGLTSRFLLVLAGLHLLQRRDILAQCISALEKLSHISYELDTVPL